MKRVLSLVLALVLVLGSMPLAFADEHMTAGDQLYDWGLIAGTSATEKALDEEGTLTRAQLMVLLAELNGVKEDAMNFELPSGFSDVDAEAWYAPYVAYGKMAGWTAGYPDGTFKPGNAVSAQEMASFILNVLGYEVVWATAVEDAAAMGVDVEVMNTAMLTRGEGFAFMLAAINTVPNGETEKLGVKLGVLEPEAPVVVEPEELEVVSVEALNLVQIEVVFNQEVDADTAEDEDNYSVDDEDFTVVSADLQEDAMTVVLTLDFDDVPDQEVASEVTIDDVENLDGDVLDKVTFEIEFLDKTFPEAVKAEVIGNDTVKIYFSEPVEGNADGTINKSFFAVEDEYVKEVELVNNNMEANVEIYSTFEEGMIEVTAKNDIEDFAGYSILTTKFEVEVVEDTEEPYVVSYKDADEYGVTLVFNEDIEFFDGDDTYFYHTNSSNKSSEATIDGNELTLKFEDDGDDNNLMPEGVVYVYVPEDAVNDKWDNENTSDIRVAIEIEIDETAPVVESVETGDNEDEVEVTFSENVFDMTRSEASDYFTLLDDEGDDADIRLRAVTIDDEVVTLTYAEKLSGDYTMVIEDVEDLSGNKVEDTSIDFTVDDATAPDDEGDFTANFLEDGDDYLIKITFSEEMATSGRYSIDDLEKYVIDGHDLVDLDDDYGVDLTVVDGGEALEIEIYDAVDALGLQEDDEVLVSRVADVSDNYTNALVTPLALKPFGTIKLEEAIAIDDETIEIELSAALDEFEESDIILSGGAFEIGVDIQDDGKLLVVTVLEGEMGTNPSDLTIVLADTTESKGIYGENLSIDGGSLAVIDEVAPTVVEDGISFILTTHESSSAAVITVEFTENMSADFDGNIYAAEVSGGFEVVKFEFINSYEAVEITIVEEDGEDFDEQDLYGQDITFDSNLRDARENKIDADDNGYEIEE